MAFSAIFIAGGGASIERVRKPPQSKAVKRRAPGQTDATVIYKRGPAGPLQSVMTQRIDPATLRQPEILSSVSEIRQQKNPTVHKTDRTESMPASPSKSQVSMNKKEMAPLPTPKSVKLNKTDNMATLHPRTPRYNAITTLAIFGGEAHSLCQDYCRTKFDSDRNASVSFRIIKKYK